MNPGFLILGLGIGYAIIPVSLYIIYRMRGYFAIKEWEAEQLAKEQEWVEFQDEVRKYARRAETEARKDPTL